MNYSAPRWLWLWPPLAIVVLQVGSKALDEDFYRAVFRGELGLVENGTVLFLVSAVFLAVRIFLMRDRVRSNLFGPFALMMALGCFFFAGEEASWGQHWIGYETPDVIAERNDQGEFNLHNDPFLEMFLDQPPRLALTLAALIGGLCAPLFRRKRKLNLPVFDGEGIWGWIWPTMACLPTSAVALVVTFPKKFFEEVPSALDISPGETKEFCLALFLLVYLLVLHRQLRRVDPAGNLNAATTRA